MNNFNIFIILLLILIYLNYNKIIKQYIGGIKFIETYEIKLKKSKDNYRTIIHNIIIMDKILEHNKIFLKNHNFVIKLKHLKLLKKNEFKNLSNILKSIKKTNIITNKLIKEETPIASKYARLFIAKQILDKTLNKNTDKQINNIKLL